MNEFIRLYLPLYLVIFFIAVFLFRIFIVWKNSGVNAYVLLNASGPYGTIGFYFKLITYLNVIAVIAFAYFPDFYLLLEPLQLLEHKGIKCLGIIILLLTLPLICIAQAQMGNSWRITIDDNNSTEMITTGLFSITRNPIFLMMKFNLLGAFLVIPNSVTLAVWLTGFALIDVQVSLEEEYLKKEHGSNYLNYSKTVKRWL